MSSYLSETIRPIPLVNLNSQISRKVYLLVGYKCNEQCEFCGLGEEKGVTWPLHNEIMYEKEEVLKRIDGIVRSGFGERDAIEFSGGEPTIHKDIIAIIKHTRSEFDGSIYLFSNGLRFAATRFAAQYAEAGVDNTIITLHGSTPDIHDQITKLPGSWKKTMNGLKNLHALGHPISIKLIVNKRNYHDCQAWAELVSEHFPNARVMINGLALWGQAKKNLTEMFVPFDVSAPYVSEAMDVFASCKMTAGIYFMPACVFDPYYWQFFGYRHYLESVLEARSEAKELKSVSYSNCYNMPSACSSCLMQPRCTWAWQPYEKQHGLHALKPVLVRAS